MRKKSGRVAAMELTVSPARTSPPSLFTVQPQARKRMRDFFSSHIRNKNTRRAYMEAAGSFLLFVLCTAFKIPPR